MYVRSNKINSPLNCISQVLVIVLKNRSNEIRSNEIRIRRELPVNDLKQFLQRILQEIMNKKYLNNWTLGRQIICPSEPECYILDFRISSMSSILNHFGIFSIDILFTMQSLVLRKSLKRKSFLF